ncbi:hypothetical protein HOK68_02005 [Candidatus Woesearchaeota archaeon]|jgi:hypothetical protein|nr:hypothetical protein [Candidatus Woesearchaeota archaeon]MBT4387771.1 hypothetical protein [Candidatus Woesearchaeota archaeon]MBT4595590.1 hypothetical protein [Candidatus Woesearchaeota archaeon]MBT5740927.1 hypothetical protein [Candidatus Woesearchaeota archaeon]MBT6505529.1 hypothetical protein [Candidatus Woesearchaeota archaeon]
MDKKLYKKLKQKKWSEEEILKTANIIKRNKQKSINLEFQYFLILLLCIIGNLLASILVIPILIKFNNNFAFVYVFITIIAFVFGVLINYALGELEIIDDKYSTLVLIFVSFIIIFNSVNVLDFSNTITQNILLSLGRESIMLEPFAIGLIYFIAYLIPYSSFRYSNRNRLAL